MSHETIYRSLFIQARGAFKKELTRYLRSKRTIRRSRQATRKGRGGGQIQDLISIRERPAAVEDRAVPGHWEGDLLAGSNNSHMVTLVERHSPYVMLAKVASKDTETIVTELLEHAGSCRATILVLRDGYKASHHYHPNQDGIWVVLKGRVRFFGGPEEKVVGEYGPFEGIAQPENSRYGFEAVGEEEAWLMQIAGYPKGKDLAKRIPLVDSARPEGGTKVNLARPLDD